MFKLFQKILSVFIAVLVLVTTSGFRIYSHDCDCCGSDEISFVEIDTCCEEEQTALPCDLIHSFDTPCCPPIEITDILHDCETSGCCEVQADFFKLNNIFDKSKVLNIKYPVLENYMVQVVDTEALTEKTITRYLQVADNSPPKIPFRDFVIFGHALKIDC